MSLDISVEMQYILLVKISQLCQLFSMCFYKISSVLWELGNYYCLLYESLIIFMLRIILVSVYFHWIHRWASCCWCYVVVGFSQQFSVLYCRDSVTDEEEGCNAVDAEPPGCHGYRIHTEIDAQDSHQGGSSYVVIYPCNGYMTMDHHSAVRLII